LCKTLISDSLLNPADSAAIQGGAKAGVITQLPHIRRPPAGTNFKALKRLRAGAVIAQIDPLEKGYLYVDRSGKLRLPALRQLGNTVNLNDGGQTNGFSLTLFRPTHLPSETRKGAFSAASFFAAPLVRPRMALRPIWCLLYRSLEVILHPARSPDLTTPSRRMSDMQETAQQYVQRILGHAEGRDPLKVQATTPSKLARLTKGVPSSKLRKRPAPDKWSVVEILAHLGDAEIVVAWRIRSILGAPGTALQAYDQNAWVAAGHYAKRDARECLEQFRAVRGGNLALLKSLTAEQWKNHGMHAERGQETIEHIVRLMAGHDLNHLQQVERILSTKK
jgi:hypothetical protein